MKKKTIIICIIVAVAVFASSLTAALFIFNGKKDSDYSLSSDNTPDGKAVKTELKACNTPEDYYDLARQYVDDHKLFYANEIIREGYRVTGDKSLDIAVITGKPTLESSIIGYTLGNVSDSVQYFLGRETVISRPCYSGLSRYNNAFIYHFDSSNDHRINAIEIGSFLSYDQLDNDLLNIAIAGEMQQDFFERHIHGASDGVFQYVDELIGTTDHHADVPITLTYLVNYGEDGKINKIQCGDEDITVTSTTSGYDISIPATLRSEYYTSSTDARRLTINMQQDNILRLNDNDEESIFSESFNYASDGSYTQIIQFNEDEIYHLSYNKDNLLTTLETENHINIKFSYNDKQMLSQIFGTDQEKNASLGVSYYDDLYMTNFVDFLFLYYDSENRYVSYSVDDSPGPLYHAVTLSYDQKGRIARYIQDYATDGIGSSESTNDNESEDGYELTYNDSGLLQSFIDKESEKVYLPVRNTEGIITGISQQDADIWTLEGNKLYPGIGELDESKVYITHSQDDSLSFVVRHATKEDFEGYVQKYKEAGYAVNLSPSEDTKKNMTEYEYRLLDNKNDPSKAVIITFKENTDYYEVIIHDFKVFYSYADADDFLNGKWGFY